MEDIRTYWEVPAVAHFVSLFRNVFHLKILDSKTEDIDIEDFEEALIVDTDSAEAGGRSKLIVDLLIALLKGTTGRKDLTILNYNSTLYDYLDARWVREELGPNPLGPGRDEAISFHSLPVYAKLKILHFLCEWRLDRPDVESTTKNLDAESLRVNEFGRDDAGNVYWYFYGTRLYKEKPKPVKIRIKNLSPKKEPEIKPITNKAKKTPKRRGRKSKGSSKKKKSGGGGKVSPVRRSSRQAIKKLGTGDSGSEEEEENPELEEEEDEDLQERIEEEDAPQSSSRRTVKNTDDDEDPMDTSNYSSRSESRLADAPSSKRPIPSRVSKLKSELEATESGRSSPNSSETGDGTMNSTNFRDMIERIYSCEDEDEDSRMSAFTNTQENEGAKKEFGNGGNGTGESKPGSPENSKDDLDKTVEIDDLENQIDGESESNGNSTADRTNEFSETGFYKTSTLQSNGRSLLEPEISSIVKPDIKEEPSEISVTTNCSVKNEASGFDVESRNGSIVKADSQEAAVAKPENKENARVFRVPVGPPAWTLSPSLFPDPEETALWELVCASLGDWKDLCESLQGSKSKTERELQDLIEKEFLPEMEKLFAQKERNRQRKLAELMPRRSSGRIELKKLERDLERKKLAEKEKIETEKLSRRDRATMKKYEQDKREQRLKMRELEKEKTQKLKERAREERARRLDLRKQRQALTAAGLEVPPELMSNECSNLDDESDNDLELEIELEHMYGQLEKVLDMLKNCPEAEPFLHPVDRTEAPDYDEKISDPIDLEMIENKLLEQEYKNTLEFIDDVNKVFINCFVYNGWKSDYTRMAQKCERVFIKAMKKNFPPAEIPEGEEAALIEKLGALDRKIREALGEKMDRNAPRKPPGRGRPLSHHGRELGTNVGSPAAKSRRRVFDSTPMCPPQRIGYRSTVGPSTSVPSQSSSLGSVAMHDYGGLIRKPSGSPFYRGALTGPRQRRQPASFARTPPQSDSDPDNPKWKIRVTSTPLAGKYNQSPARQRPQLPGETDQLGSPIGSQVSTSAAPIRPQSSFVHQKQHNRPQAMYQIRQQQPYQAAGMGSTASASSAVYRGYQGPTPVSKQPQPRILQGPRVPVSSPPRTKEKPNVYLIPMEDGNRLVKFVDRAGQPVPADYVNQILPQIRREAHKLPKGLVTMTLNFDSVAEAAPTKIRIPDIPGVKSQQSGGAGSQYQQPSTSFPGYQASTRTTMIQPKTTTTTQRTVQIQRQPTMAVSHVQKPKLSIPVSQFVSPSANQPTQSAVSGSKSEQKSPTKLYGIGRDNYLMIDNGVPYLMKKQDDGSLVRVQEVSKEELVEKLNSIRVQKQAAEVSRPVCSVAPQPKSQAQNAATSSGVEVSTAPSSTVYLQSTSQNQPPVAVVLNQNPQQKSEAVIVGTMGSGTHTLPLVFNSSAGSNVLQMGNSQTLVISTSSPSNVQTTSQLQTIQGSAGAHPQQFQVIQVMPQIVVNQQTPPVTQDTDTDQSSAASESER